MSRLHWKREDGQVKLKAGDDFYPISPDVLEFVRNAVTEAASKNHGTYSVADVYYCLAGKLRALPLYLEEDLRTNVAGEAAVAGGTDPARAKYHCARRGCHCRVFTDDFHCCQVCKDGTACTEQKSHPVQDNVRAN
jgi:hypothetical protein